MSEKLVFPEDFLWGSARMYSKIAKDNAISKQLLDKYELTMTHKSNIQPAEQIR